jgi:hypothetical protein
VAVSAVLWRNCSTSDRVTSDMELLAADEVIVYELLN